MYKIIIGIVFMILMMSLTSHAEEKLFITDVLAQKQVEAQASFMYEHQTVHFCGKPPSLGTGSQETDVSKSEYSLGVGLGRGFEVGVSIPYAFSDRTETRFDTLPPETMHEKRDGFGDISLGAKYRVFGEKDKPFTLVAGLDVKLDSASEDKGGTGSTDISPFVAASTTVAKGLRPYAAYELTISNHGRADTHKVRFGAEKELNERATINASFQASLHTSSESLSSYEVYSFGITSYICIYRNLYAIPMIGFGVASSADLKDVDVHFDSSTGTVLGIGLYYLF